MRRLSWVALALIACEPQEQPIEGGAAPDAPGVIATPEPAERALQLRGCRQEAGLNSVGGAWLARFETTSSVAGPGLSAQGEIVTRFGVAELCQDGTAVEADILVCTIHQSAVADGSQTCAAQIPAGAVVAALPTVRTRGAFIANQAQVQVVLPWAERWGLAPDAAWPDEPQGVAQIEPAGLVDQDEDGRPGVTLRGDGPVPTEVWAVRETSTQWVIEQGDGLVLLGRTAGTRTAQTVLGGPATRVVRGRRRQGLDGALALVRADGLSGAPRVDANGDGRISCAEVAPHINTTLAAPIGDACERASLSRAGGASALAARRGDPREAPR